MTCCEIRPAMPKRFLSLAFALLLAGCAGAPPAPTPPSPPQVPTPVVEVPDFETPVIQDRAPARRYSAEEGRALERRSGYRVDHSVRSAGVNQRVRYLVIHYTGGDDAAALRALTGSQVGTHYLVLDQPGEFQQQPVVLQLADESMRAWHAGVSAWGDREGLNDTSIGIEIVNPGFTQTPSGLSWSPFSESQIQLVIALAKDIVQRYDIEPTNVVAHSDISPGRKLDPGPFFPWQRLAQAGVGAWPERATVARYLNQFSNGRVPSVRALQQGLARYGYRLEPTGRMDDQTLRVLKSFQMRFRPTDHTGFYDAESAAILFALIEKYHGPAQAGAILASS